MTPPGRSKSSDATEVGLITYSSPGKTGRDTSKGRGISKDEEGVVSADAQRRLIHAAKRASRDLAAAAGRVDKREAVIVSAGDMLRQALNERLTEEDTLDEGEVRRIVTEVAERVSATAHPVAALVGPVFTTSGVRAITGMTRQALDSRRKARTVIAAQTSDGHWVYPVDQFTDSGVDLRLRETLAILKDAAIDDWTLMSWWTAPAEELDGQSPLRWLLEDQQPRPVHALAQESVARWAA